MRFRTVSYVGAGMLLATAMISAQAQRQGQGRQAAPPPVATNVLAHNLNVTVKYTGAGVADEKHAVMVFLFTDPNIGANSQPVNMGMVTKNGGVASFLSIPQDKVYVAAVYDPTGAYTGRGGPPPPGVAMAIYNPAPKATTAAAVTVGPKTAITLTFDGSMKFKG